MLGNVHQNSFFERCVGCDRICDCPLRQPQKAVCIRSNRWAHTAIRLGFMKQCTDSFSFIRDNRSDVAFRTQRPGFDINSV